jgi:acetyl-CoA synthase
MSELTTIVTATSAKIVDAAQAALEKALVVQGSSASLGFKGTAFFLPLNFALTGLEVKTVGEASRIIENCRRLLEGKPLESGLSFSCLDGWLDYGMAALLAEELLCALTHEPTEGYLGFVPDTVLRSLGVQLVDGRIAGIAVILGCAKDDASAVKIIRGFQEKNIVSLLVGNAGSRNIRDQLTDAGVELGLDNYIVCLGPDELSSAYAVNFAVRAALTFGGCKGG